VSRAERRAVTHAGVARIRLAGDDDGDALADVIATVFAQYPNCPFDRAAEFPELDAVATHYAGRGGRLWVTEDEAGRVVGCFGIAATSAPGVFEICKVYLLPQSRGRGAAGAMLRRALDFARAGGAREVRLWSDTRFFEGHAFYDRNGFQRVPVKRYLADLGHTWEYAFRKVIDDDTRSADA
jgi:putative acetyltransferase